MLNKTTIAVCSEIHIQNITTIFRQNVEFLNVNLMVHIITTGLDRINNKLNVRSFNIWNRRTKVPACQLLDGLV